MSDAETPEVDTDDLPAEPDVERRHGVPVTSSRGQEVLHPGLDAYVDVVQALHDEGYTVCIDLCGVDYLTFPDREVAPGVTGERFEVVVNLLDLDGRRRVRLRVQVPADEPTVPSLWSIHPGTEAMEREAYDMFGLTFAGHPDLSRILMPEDWVGHPLRKDFATGRIPVQFKEARR